MHSDAEAPDKEADWTFHESQLPSSVPVPSPRDHYRSPGCSFYIRMDFPLPHS